MHKPARLPIRPTLNTPHKRRNQMDQLVTHAGSGPPSQHSSYPGSGKAGTDSVGNPVDRGKDAIASAASTAAGNASSDLESLRADFNGLKEAVTKFISQEADQAS